MIICRSLWFSSRPPRTYFRKEILSLVWRAPASTTSAIHRGLLKRNGDSSGSRHDTKIPFRSEEKSPRSLQAPSRPTAHDVETLPNYYPISVPYTTASSQFLYGTSSVKAALHANRRKLHKLYVLRSEQKLSYERSEIEKLARTRDVNVKVVDDSWIPLLDKISGSRPHNGVALEASALPILPVKSLSEVSIDDEKYSLTLESRGNEDDITKEALPVANFRSNGWRQPFVLLLDQVLDPGNLGAILRSAYYFGVDAVAITIAGSSPITSTALKAAAGAAEDLIIFKTNDAATFVKDSKIAGWEIHCADKPEDMSQAQPSYNPSPVYKKILQKSIVSVRSRVEMTKLLRRRPCLLVIGGEGHGISRMIRGHTDWIVSVPSESHIDKVALDSLNVSVATAVLCAEYLRPPNENATKVDDDDALSHNLGFDFPEGDDAGYNEYIKAQGIRNREKGKETENPKTGTRTNRKYERKFDRLGENERFRNHERNSSGATSAFDKHNFAAKRQRPGGFSDLREDGRKERSSRRQVPDLHHDDSKGRTQQRRGSRGYQNESGVGGYDRKLNRSGDGRSSQQKKSAKDKSRSMAGTREPKSGKVSASGSNAWEALKQSHEKQERRGQKKVDRRGGDRRRSGRRKGARN